MQFEHAVMNGKVVPFKDATAPLGHIGFTYGYGVYETVRAHNGVAYFIREHSERLLRSASIINLAHQYSREDIEGAVNTLLRVTKTAVYNIKILLVGGKTAEDLIFCVIPSAPLFPDRKLYRDGARVVSVEFERPFPQAKTLSMLGSYLAYERAVREGCYDALAVNRNGCVTEGTRTNMLAMRGRTIISPPREDILLGVTRAIVLDIARKNGFTVEEQPIPLNSLGDYESLFLTSTSSKIMPVTNVDNGTYTFAISSELRELMKLYSDFYDNCNGEYCSSTNDT